VELSVAPAAQVTEFPFTTPINTFLPGVVAAVPCGVSVATGTVLPAFCETYSTQPVSGVVQTLCGAAGPKPGT